MGRPVSGSPLPPLSVPFLPFSSSCLPPSLLSFFPFPLHAFLFLLPGPLYLSALPSPLALLLAGGLLCRKVPATLPYPLSLESWVRAGARRPSALGPPVLLPFRLASPLLLFPDLL